VYVPVVISSREKPSTVSHAGVDVEHAQIAVDDAEEIRRERVEAVALLLGDPAAAVALRPRRPPRRTTRGRRATCCLST
jgi:hypothetical protein